MSISIQTNVNSLVAQENLRVNGMFQSRTIQRLTSGFRINSSGDDAAGLAVANRFRSNTAELSQGVRNANDGVGQLQIVDGGLGNITNIMDRLKTLATESASDTFTGDRTTLNSEYQSLLGEINRQASNIGLVSGGTNNSVLSVYIGGGSSAANASLSIDLSGSANQVDSTGLQLATTNIAAGGTKLTGNVVNLNNTGGTFTGNQTFTFQIAGQAAAVSVSTGAGNTSSASAITSVNSQLSKYGISASIASDGTLQFSGGAAFSVAADATANGIATINTTANFNSGLYAYANTFTALVGGPENVTVTNGQGSANLVFTTSDTLTSSIATMNTQLNSIGLNAVQDAAGTGFSLQGASTFTVNKTLAAVTSGTVFGSAVTTGAVALSNTAPTTGSSAAKSSLLAIQAAVAQLGTVQGRVGAGQNKLSYSIALAQSQISNFSSAESQIRDADIAAEAANLTKAQVLQQASIAAMAQANSAPQQVLALLRG